MSQSKEYVLHIYNFISTNYVNQLTSLKINNHVHKIQIWFTE